MSRLEYLKNFMPMDMMFNIKYRRELNIKKTLQLIDGKHIFFLDAPDYGNIGDQAIAYAIFKFAENNFSDYQFIEVLQKDVASYIDFLKENIKQDDIIFLTGGGNMGNYYRIYEATRRKIIKTFKNNQIVIFPQSMMYSDDIWGKISLNKAKSIYNNHPNLVVCAREKFSFEKMKSVFNNVVLCPDIVLSLAASSTQLTNVDRETIGICLRNDIEQSLNYEQRAFIMESAESLGRGVSKVSTTGDYGIIDFNNRERIVFEKLSQIANCSVLVTDRLHAMIFSVITGTPCVVFNNNNLKIAGTVIWLGRYKGVVLLKSTVNIKDEVLKMMQLDIKGNLDLDYSPLINQIGK